MGTPRNRNPGTESNLLGEMSKEKEDGSGKMKKGKIAIDLQRQ